MSFSDKAQGHLSTIDKEVSVHTISIYLLRIRRKSSPEVENIRLTMRQLSKYPTLNNLEKQTNVPKVYAFLGLVGTYFFLIFFNIGGQFLTNLAGFAIPSYYSLEALFSVGKADDTQWLTVYPIILITKKWLADLTCLVLGGVCLLDTI